jgi:C-terminal processing protease CtpA/Prc
MRRRRLAALLCFTAALTACGGGGGGGGPIAGGGGGGGGGGTSSCSLLDRQNWAAASIREWYLFPELLPASLSPSGFTTVDDYIDALTATARAQGKDRFFTYLTSISAENAFFNSGSSAGFGIRLSIDTVNRRLFIAEAFEGAPALAAGIDRGTEILAIGDTQATLRTVDSIIAAEGPAGIDNAIGPSTAGPTRWFRAVTNGVTTEFSVTKASYTLTPVSSRYGVKVLNDGTSNVGYVNLRTFIDTADPALRNAFSSFRTQGISKAIVDLRYNGGGLVSIAELRHWAPHDVQRHVLPDVQRRQSSNNTTTHFNPQAQSVSLLKTPSSAGGTASASELVINA